MDKLVENIETITDFREALTLWVRAKHQAVSLEQDHKVARAEAFLDGAGKTQAERWAKVDLENEELARKAEMAKVRAKALYYLALHLKGGEEEELDVDLDEL